MDGAHPGPKTDRDHIMKYNLRCYCHKIFEMAKGKKESAARSRLLQHIFSVI